MAAGVALLSATSSARAQGAAGFTIAARLQHAAYRVADAPSVIVHAPPGFRAHAPLHLVVFLHGYRGCVNVLMARGPARCAPGQPLRDGWDLGRYHDAARTNTLFVVPQLAFMQRTARPGAFARPGVFRQFLQELLAGPLAAALGGKRSLADVGGIDLLAHSAGYQTAFAILERGGVRKLIKNVVLFDALYAHTADFARFAERAAGDGVHFVSIALPHGTPARENAVLLSRLRRSLGGRRVAQSDSQGLTAALADHAIVIATGRPPHRLVPAHYMSAVLRALHPARAH